MADHQSPGPSTSLVSEPVQSRDVIVADFHARCGDLFARHGNAYPPGPETGIPPGGPVWAIDESSIAIAIGKGDQAIAGDARLPYADSGLSASDGVNDPLMAEGSVIVRKAFTDANTDSRHQAEKRRAPARKLGRRRVDASERDRGAGKTSSKRR